MSEKLNTNLDKVAKQRAALRRAIAEAGADSTAVVQDIRAGRNPEEHSLKTLSGLKKKITSRIAGNLAETEKTAKTLSAKGKEAFAKAKERVRTDKRVNERTVLDEDALRREIGPIYDEYMQDERDGYELRDIETAWLQSKTDSVRNELREIARDIRKNRSELAIKNRKEHPREMRAVDLTTYVDELSREGHIAQTPDVNYYLAQIGERMRTGKPVFLHGPTGTGKTSLARRAAKNWSGHDAEMVYCNPQTRESNIWGKTGIRPVKDGGGAIETIDVLGPLARGMQEGKPVIFDEFTALPKEQMVFIKGILNAKPGDTVNVVGNGRITISRGFQMIFTANLKSDKNPERQELPPEIAREFEQNNLEVLYNPRNETYDIILARLMQPDGSVQMSWHDLNTTLPKFCEALLEIQRAYYDRESADMAKLTGTQDASGKTPSLKKFVMTQGTVEAILESWKAHKEQGGATPFVRFLDSRLAIGLTFKEYPESDRILAAKILASKGLLRTVNPRQLGLPKDIFDFDAANAERSDEAKLKQLLEDSGRVVRVGIMQLADLDPFNVRKKPAAQAAQQFLTPEESKAPLRRQTTIPAQVAATPTQPQQPSAEQQILHDISLTKTIDDLMTIQNSPLGTNISIFGATRDFFDQHAASIVRESIREARTLDALDVLNKKQKTLKFASNSILMDLQGYILEKYVDLYEHLIDQSGGLDELKVVCDRHRRSTIGFPPRANELVRNRIDRKYKLIIETVLKNAQALEDIASIEKQFQNFKPLSPPVADFVLQEIGTRQAEIVAVEEKRIEQLFEGDIQKVATLKDCEELRHKLGESKISRTGKNRVTNLLDARYVSLFTGLIAATTRGSELSELQKAVDESGVEVSRKSIMTNAIEDRRKSFSWFRR